MKLFILALLIALTCASSPEEGIGRRVTIEKSEPTGSLAQSTLDEKRQWNPCYNVSCPTNYVCLSCLDGRAGCFPYTQATWTCCGCYGSSCYNCQYANECGVDPRTCQKQHPCSKCTSSEVCLNCGNNEFGCFPRGYSSWTCCGCSGGSCGVCQYGYQCNRYNPFRCDF
eukprot:TRINITY_DN8185_c0_g1_i1.p1 TRINITY_DN8185_c0_g1~~TRINITY_DN8185_c0_g1_i1.p1  ORF type:complete len:169 (-),score=16.99 TRINITY_DN8185_c0_g1_i1:47-553(-)